MELFIADDPSIYLLADLRCGVESKAGRSQRDRSPLFAVAHCRLCGMVVHPAMHHARLFGDPFQDQRHYENEVSGFGPSRYGCMQRIFQSSLHAAHCVRGIASFRISSKLVLAESCLLCGLRVRDR